MKIFLCWSGERSKHIALALRDWLPQVIQSVAPWMSDEDINKGAKWSVELTEQLETTDFGIVCLTPENKSNDWILYETGALSKKVKESFVVPYLFDVSTSDVAGPFTLFQMARSNKSDTFKTLSSENASVKEGKLTSKQLRVSFEKWWPDLETSLNSVPKTKKVAESVERPDRELLEELLSRVRDIPLAVEESGKGNVQSYSEIKTRVYIAELDHLIDKLTIWGYDAAVSVEFSRIIEASFEYLEPRHIRDLRNALGELKAREIRRAEKLLMNTIINKKNLFAGEIELLIIELNGLHKSDSQ